MTPSDSSSSSASLVAREEATTPSRQRQWQGAGVSRQSSPNESSPEVGVTPRTSDLINEAHSHHVAVAPLAVRVTADPPPGEPLFVGSCIECGVAITGAVFMLHDLSYCCQRHRLTAYHKMERDGKSISTRLVNGSNMPLQSSPSGLRASFVTWM